MKKRPIGNNETQTDAIISDRSFWQFLKSLRNALWRLLVYLDTLGLSLPGHKKARAQLEQETVDYFERKKILRGLRSARYVSQRGPIWLRPLLDFLSHLWERNRFWFLLFLKLVAGTSMISLPFALFFLIRGVLPVPSRVPVVLRPTLTTDTQGFSASFSPFMSVDGKIQTASSGALPRKIFKTEAFFLSSMEPLRLAAAQSYRPSVAGQSFLRFQVLADNTSAPKLQETCELTLSDERGETLFQGVFGTESPKGLLSSGLQRVFQSRFTPQFETQASGVPSIRVDVKRFPSLLQAKIRSVLPENLDKAEEKDKGKPSCSYFMTPPLFQMEETYPRSSGGALLIAVEGLGTLDGLSWEGESFAQHRVLHSNPDQSMSDLLSLDSRVSLPLQLARSGYATFYAGNLFRTDLSTKGFQTTLGLETPEYAARHVTEEFAEWLSEREGAGYFAVLKYDLLSPPYRPPFAKLNLKELFTHPFGLKREKTLRQGSLDALNEELNILKEHLHSQGRWENSDVVLTSNVPLHLSEKLWQKDLDTDRPSASRTFTGSTWEGDTRVPLFWKPSRARKTSAPSGVFTLPTGPSSHEDLAKVLADSLLSEQAQWPQRRQLALIGADEISALSAEKSGQLVKYTFPFRAQSISVATRGFPFRETKILAPEERFSAVGGPLDEQPLKKPESRKIQALREALFDLQFKEGKPVKLMSGSTPGKLELEIASRVGKGLSWRKLPDWAKIEKSTAGDQQTWKLTVHFPTNGVLELFWDLPEMIVLKSNVALVSVCQGTWNIPWTTAARWMESLHPCLLQEDRMNDLVRDSKSSSRDPAAGEGPANPLPAEAFKVNVSFFH